jgi:hypothetical protein
LKQSSLKLSRSLLQKRPGEAWNSRGSNFGHGNKLDLHGTAWYYITLHEILQHVPNSIKSSYSYCRGNQVFLAYQVFTGNFKKVRTAHLTQTRQNGPDFATTTTFLT